MEPLQEDLQTLMELGLTLLQAKVYLGLVQTGTANVREIAQVSKVARPDVYRILSKLHEFGLIDYVIAKPSLFRAIPTQIALKVLMHHKTQKHKELKTKTTALIHKYNKKNNHDLLQADSKFVYVPSKEALISKLKKAIDSTQESIDASTSCKRFTYACYILGRRLKNAWNRDVKGRVVINSTEQNQPALIKECWRAPWADIRYTPTVPRTVMVMYDKKEVFIFTKPESNLKDSPALWSNDPSLLAMAEDFFELLWITAMEISEYNLDNIQK